MTNCPADFELVEPRIDRVLTQYRESPRLLHLIRTHLRQVEIVSQAVCELSAHFDIDTAVGDQLTLLGKRLGWPRCHCVNSVQPVFGMLGDTGVQDYPIAGFCDSAVTWVDCGEFGVGDVCIGDDDLYRRFLKVRRYQMMALFDIDSLTEAVQLLWGAQALVLAAGHGRVVVAPGRNLTDPEIALLQLYPRILPIAPGVLVRFHLGPFPVFGFGEGWGGFCDYVVLSGQAILAGSRGELVTEDGAFISTGPLTQDAEWMCETDVSFISGTIGREQLYGEDLHPVGPVIDTDTAPNVVEVGAAAGTYIGLTVLAIDRNSGDAVQYTVNDVRFQVETTGVVRTNNGAPFDADTEPSIDLMVTATSTDGSQSEAAFQVTVIDPSSHRVFSDEFSFEFA